LSYYVLFCCIINFIEYTATKTINMILNFSVVHNDYIKLDKYLKNDHLSGSHKSPLLLTTAGFSNADRCQYSAK